MAKKRLRYNGPSPVVEIAETGDLVDRGATVVVDEELAERLLEQGAEISIEVEVDDNGEETTVRTVTRPDEGAPWSAAGGPVPSDDEEGSS